MEVILEIKEWKNTETLTHMLTFAHRLEASHLKYSAVDQ